MLLGDFNFVSYNADWAIPETYIERSERYLADVDKCGPLDVVRLETRKSGILFPHFQGPSRARLDGIYFSYTL